MTKIKIKTNKQYRFCGNGDGVAGLPHAIDEQEAHKRGVLKILTAALRNGSYQEVDPAVEEDSLTGQVILGQGE